GYWWWVPAGGDTAAQVFALWQVTGTSAGTLVPGATVTSGPLVAGQWNFTPLAFPIQLTPGIPYTAQTGYVAAHGFPDTANQFGGGEPFVNGITNGPLNAYSDVSGTGGTNQMPAGWLSQGAFATSTADPTALLANLGSSGSSNFWVDTQVSDQAPTGASYRLWPSMPTPAAQLVDTANNFTLGTEIVLSQSCTLKNIWYYSQPGATQLATEIGVWTVPGQSLVAATHIVSPSWSGTAGSGWVSSGFSGVTLPAGEYKVTVFNGAVTPTPWNISQANYWTTGGGANGITVGPLSAPNNAGATSPGQSSYHQGAVFTFPDTNSGPFTYWVDIEVIPVQSNVPFLSIGRGISTSLLAFGGDDD